MTQWLRAGAVISLTLVAMACGGDSDSSDAGTGSGGTSGGGTSGGGTSGGGTGGTSSTGTPDSGTSTGGMGMPVMCDTTITDMPTCGSNTCGPLSALNACIVRCCLAGDTCGYRDSTMGMTTDCVAAPPEDPDCPDVAIFGTTMYPGCCMADGESCGYISPSMNACAAPPGMASGNNCDGTMDADAGGP